MRTSGAPHAATARTLAYLIALAVPLLAIGGALVAQYDFGLAPCELCWWQRYGHLAAIGLALAGWLARRGAWGDRLIALAALAIVASGLVGALHAGVEWHWWQGPTTCSSARLGSDPLATIMAAPLVRCDVAAWRLLGISMAGYNFLLSAGAALAIGWLLRRGREGRAA